MYGGIKIKMKKSILLVVATLVGVTVAPALTTNSQNVQASETTVREAKSVKVYGPIENGPLHKYVSNVYRYSSWGRGDGMNLLNTTPSKVYYNDGAYSGYLYRNSTWMDHNFKTNRNRWVSMYSGNVRLISRGLVPNN